MININKIESERNEAIQQLREMLNPDTMVYTILRHVSNSGMLRAISVIIIKDNKPLDISYLVSKALGWKLHQQHYGIKVSGCGMDMGFHLVYSLSRTIFNNDSRKQEPQNKNNPNVTNNVYEKDCGYWLNHNWL